MVKNVQKAFKKLSEAFWSGNKCSGVFFLDFGEIDRFWLWCGIFHDQEDPDVYIYIIYIICIMHIPYIYIYIYVYAYT